MDAPIENPADESIGDLFHKLVEDGRTWAGAEATLYKEVALYRVGKARAGLVALVVGGLLAFAGLVAALVGLVLGLAPMIGPVGGGLVVLAATGIVGLLLVRYGMGRLAALSGDPDEKAALAAGDRR